MKHIKGRGEFYASHMVFQFCMTEMKDIKDQRWPQIGILFLPLKGGL